MLGRLLPVWGLRLPPALPPTEVPALLSHLSLLVSPGTPNPTPSLPSDTLSFLIPLVPAAFPALLLTSEGLYDMIASSSSSDSRHPLLSSPAPSAAAGLLLVSLEGHARRHIPNIGILSEALGTRLGIAGRTVAARYRLALDAVEEAGLHVPWLQSSAAADTLRPSGRKRALNPKRADGRRLQIARIVLDVVAYYRARRRSHVEQDGPVRVSLDVDSEEDDDDSEVPEPEILSSKNVYAITDDSVASHKRKARDVQVRPRKRKQPSRSASRLAEDFLLNPLAFLRPSDSFTNLTTPSLDHTTHLLAPDAHIARGRGPPTRLQLLASLRGGEAEIRDDELFAEGELEAFIATPEEVARREPVLEALFGDQYRVLEERHREKESRVTEGRENAARKGIGRMNADALAHILRDNISDEEQFSEGFGDDGAGVMLLDGHYFDDDTDDDCRARESDCNDDGDVEVLPWRAASPGGQAVDYTYDF
jgi:hypothetical protein